MIFAQNHNLEQNISLLVYSPSSGSSSAAVMIKASDHYMSKFMVTEPGQTRTNPEEAAEIARKKGMAKGTAGASETGSEYEQGAAGSNK